MQNWEEHQENQERFLKSCLDDRVTRRTPARVAAQSADAAFEPGCEIAVQPVVVPS